jgi:hypothetical protein
MSTPKMPRVDITTIFFCKDDPIQDFEFTGTNLCLSQRKHPTSSKPSSIKVYLAHCRRSAARYLGGLGVWLKAVFALQWMKANSLFIASTLAGRIGQPLHPPEVYTIVAVVAPSPSYQS